MTVGHTGGFGNFKKLLFDLLFLYLGLERLAALVIAASRTGRMRPDSRAAIGATSRGKSFQRVMRPTPTGSAVGLVCSGYSHSCCKFNKLLITN
jgi:hypothetical protein